MNKHKLVPMEPTIDMVIAGEDAWDTQLEKRLFAKDNGEAFATYPSEETHELCSRVAYRAMLAAAPDHIPDAGEKVSREQIREVFLRNGFTIKPGCDDLREYVYKAAFELLELAAPDMQAELVAWLRFRSHRVAADDVIEGLEICEPGETGDDGGPAFPVYATPQPTPDVAGLVEALARCHHQASYSIGGEDALSIQLGKVRDIANEALAAHRKGGEP